MNVDALAFLAGAERASNDADAAACAAVYAEDARLEAFTDGTYALHDGLRAITEAWRVYTGVMRAMGLRLEKRLVARGEDGFVNEWSGTLANGRTARGIERWTFDASGRVVHHASWTSLALAPLERPSTRLRVLVTDPRVAVRFLRATVAARFGGRAAPSVP